MSGEAPQAPIKGTKRPRIGVTKSKESEGGKPLKQADSKDKLALIVSTVAASFSCASLRVSYLAYQHNIDKDKTEYIEKATREHYRQVALLTNVDILGGGLADEFLSARRGDLDRARQEHIINEGVLRSLNIDPHADQILPVTNESVEYCTQPLKVVMLLIPQDDGLAARSILVCGYLTTLMDKLNYSKWDTFNGKDSTLRPIAEQFEKEYNENGRQVFLIHAKLLLKKVPDLPEKFRDLTREQVNTMHSALDAAIYESFQKDAERVEALTRSKS